ncbi:hypothetical protein DHEL01_v209437 [Diaporthe helianthi]|uniref:Uncharacterized protein n=1 Tax=Diaporthe helianthi TaxID=158607 RepID=A0A2P5HPI6_DIAHE|nr:hypothetical protein DHEL01_v209437 [Diaporthe helianthi]
MATTMGPRPGSTGSAPAHHPSLPASPTLTNPDMILPDYPDYDRSPSPVRLDSNRPQSPLTMWRNAQAAGAPNDHNINNMLSNQASHQFTGFASAAPATPIIYGNGTMLSDIGEVTEAESTPGKPSPPRHIPARISPYGTKDRDSESDAALRSSPTMGQGGSISAIKKKAKEQAAAQRDRRSSTGSDSTVTDHHDHASLFADFSDAVSVGGDSVFQGDDEESMASSYVEESDLNGASDVQGGIPVRLSYESRQKYSTAQLSRRAEHILANAKRRLTTMEDNLTRARSSLAVASYSSGSNGSTPSPPIARATSALYMSTMSSSPSSPAFSGHSRKGSDHSLRIGLPIKVYPQRSSSVIGIPSARQPLTVSKSADQLNGHYKRTSYIVREAQAPLEPLSEDEASQLSSQARLDATYRHSSTTSPTFGSGGERGLARSASVTQMRDIKDQVNDLKGKISSLREQSRADSLKRRSMQSLRTPSPFTYSRIGQWAGASGSTAGSDTKSEADPDKPGHLSDETASIGKDSAVNIGDIGDDDDGGSVYSVENVQHLGHAQVEQLDRDSEAALRAEGFVHVEDDDDDIFTENGDINEDELEEVFDSVSEGGDSLYHEAVQHQVSHEDREDAFDYEHFFLHSAMGTISQRMARRDSNAGYTSESSIETTRGPIAENKQRRPQHSRRGSEASVSTIESFATAEEALSSRQSMDSSRNADTLDGLPEESSTPSTPSTETIDSPQTAKRATVTGIASPLYGNSGRPSPEGHRRREVMYSTIRRPTSSNAATRTIKTHRPSTSSFDSTGTTRSFPLVNRSSKTPSTGMLTPEGGSPDQAVKSITTSLMSDTTAACQEMQNGETTEKSSPVYSRHKHSISTQSISSTASLLQENGTTAVIETLPRDDQFLVERTVASLGRCVLGLTESSRASVEGRMYRRRIDAARRILEGIDQP